MSLSKIALFGFALATLVGTGLSFAEAAPRQSWSFNAYNSSVEAARFDHAKGFVQGN